MRWRTGARGEGRGSDRGRCKGNCDEAGEGLTQQRREDTARHGRQHLLRQRNLARAGRDVGVLGSLRSCSHGCLGLEVVAVLARGCVKEAMRDPRAQEGRCGHSPAWLRKW
jgi:hypothetical protein